ncbi:patatin-like phospholipase family protein [Haloferula chungangensis]|uniref:Patatin-like phospholipase family protein n=1 Tax=Haloferula chungangensis TaxID=1048331 RepID=A0ABW2L3T8_9BACT
MFGRLLRLFRHHDRPPRAGRPLSGGGRAKIGLALSSGGARGLAHVGVLQVLEENGIEIHCIAGSSMGSYVGALWAAGFSGKELGELAAEMHDRRQLWKLADPIIPPMRGLFRGLRAKEHLKRSLGDLCFEDLERRFLVITVDIDTKERIVLREGSVADAVHASCAMPGIIAPVVINGRRCVDGGVVDPIPVGALQKYSEADRIIAVSVIPTFEEVEAGLLGEDAPPPSLAQRGIAAINRNFNLLAPGNVVDTFRQSIRAAQIRIAHDSVKRADLCLRPEHFLASWHDYSNFERFIEAGRKVTLEHLDEIYALVNSDPKTHVASGKKLVGEFVT